MALLRVTAALAVPPREPFTNVVLCVATTVKVPGTSNEVVGPTIV